MPQILYSAEASLRSSPLLYIDSAEWNDVNLSAIHTDADIEATLTAFSETKKLDAGAYRVEAIPDMAESK
ncbi:MAG: hypothetical protein JNM88_02510 [Chitinophagaceae bacterium]|nr:hypothetical protein [Chitinophagaceae bacterium]